MNLPADMRALASADNTANAGPEAAKREVRSEDLFGGSHIVLIRHADSLYTLRRTSNGKLILTK
jgi:hemin uptake protein HemP